MHLPALPTAPTRSGRNPVQHTGVVLERFEPAGHPTAPPAPHPPRPPRRSRRPHPAGAALGAALREPVPPEPAGSHAAE